MRQIAAFAALLTMLVGCSTTKTVAISSAPPGASIRIDNAMVGVAPVTHDIKFSDKADIHRVTASKAGYKDQTVELTRDTTSDMLLVAMRPMSRRIGLTVLPTAAMISINGKPITDRPVSNITKELEFTLDAMNHWTTYTITAERAGFNPAKQTVTYTDPEPNYVLNLEPMRKDLSITSNPQGAAVYMDDVLLGNTPLKQPDVAFTFDPDANDYLGHKLKVMKKGYPPVEQGISWDEGKPDYNIDLTAVSKTVHFTTEPLGAKVTIDGVEAKAASDGTSSATLSFPPINNNGDLKTYTATVTKKTADSEWYPEKVSITWDEGKTDYPVHLKEIITRPVELLTADPQRGDDGWSIAPKRISTIAMKDVTEGQKRESPVQLVRAGRGEQIDTFAISPDGTTLMYTVLYGQTKSDFRSQIRAVRTDATGGVQQISDGRSLELQPCFTPDGAQIVFSSNRGSTRLSVWQMSAAGLGGVTNLTAGDAYDLWPNIDSDPKPRLFYVRLIDSRPDSRLYMTQLGTTIRTDLTSFSGTQPRVSPKNDSIIFTAFNDKTGKRDICRMADRGGLPENLTNTPDTDEFDPAWSKDGSRIAFTSDRGINEEGQRNFDIWVMNLANPERPVQITVNGSWDDNPVWDPSGNAIYFRSNRGGEWSIWKVSVR